MVLLHIAWLIDTTVLDFIPFGDNLSVPLVICLSTCDGLIIVGVFLPCLAFKFFEDISKDINEL